jgi:hypothetical protein
LFVCALDTCVLCRQDVSDGGSDEPLSRRLVAFVGGLDLAEGRYDTHHHPLFATTHQGGPHHTDMYQGCIGGRLGTGQGRRLRAALRVVLLWMTVFPVPD